MKGFDKKFKDFPNYILGITNEIWENRGIASLHHYYTKDIIVRSPSSVVVGNEDVIKATMATLVEFPDRQLLGEDVIWSGSPEEGMLSSHRILTTATHLGDGVYGEATGKKLIYRVIADCHAINNQINDEWLIRDQGSVVRQMGWDPKEYASKLIEKEGGYSHCIETFSPSNDIQGPYKGTGNNNEWGLRYEEVLNSIMHADISIITKEYDRAVQTEYAGGVSGHSFNSVNNFWMTLRSSFPSAKFKIHHRIGREDANMSPRSAIRWSLHGKHDGWGAFGKPTGSEIFILGASHVEFGPWGIRREYSLFDETSVWKQILLAQNKD